MHPGEALPSRRSSLICQEKQTAPPAGVRVLSTTLGHLAPLYRCHPEHENPCFPHGAAALRGQDRTTS